MTDLLCKGLDGANPLHALATFGLLRLTDRLEPGVCLGWKLSQSAWRPIISIKTGNSLVFKQITQALNKLAVVGAPDPSLNRRVRTLKDELNKRNNELKEAEKKARNEVKAKKLNKEEAKEYLEQAISVIKAELHTKQQDITQASEALTAANGVGIAHLGDMIGVDPNIFREASLSGISRLFTGKKSDEISTDDPCLIVAQLSGLASDVIYEDNKVTPTSLSFSNGGANQLLLNDFRFCASKCTAELVEATLLGQGEREVVGQTGLNWDPEDNREYALRWRNPANAKKSTDVAANALAYLGLSLLPAMPVGRKLATVGWGPHKAFSWPIWDSLLPISAVMSVLAYADVVREKPNIVDLVARGIVQINRSEVINPTGKRNFFAPSRPVA
jgi:hypothetical protein